MTEPSEKKGRGRRRAAAAGLVAAGAITGGVLAGTLSATAATGSSTSGYASTGSPVDASTHTRDGFPAHGTSAHEALEKPVTGSNAEKVKAAAVKVVGSGTAGAVTTDVSGNGYEVTVTKADGSKVEVHLNGSFGVDDHGRLGG